MMSLFRNMTWRHSFFQKRMILIFLIIFLPIWIIYHGIALPSDEYIFHGTILEKPRGILPFTLTGIDGRKFNNASLKNEWTLVFFGFTKCRYLCPTTLAILAKAYRLLEGEKIHPLPRVILVSIDSEHDVLPVLKRYVKGFHPAFYGVRGATEVVQEMALEMGIPYKKMISGRLDNDISHSGAVMLFNPSGKLAVFFPAPHDAVTLAEDYKAFVLRKTLRTRPLV